MKRQTWKIFYWPSSGLQVLLPELYPCLPRSWHPWPYGVWFSHPCHPPSLRQHQDRYLGYVWPGSQRRGQTDGDVNNDWMNQSQGGSRMSLIWPALGRCWVCWGCLARQRETKRWCLHTLPGAVLTSLQGSGYRRTHTAAGHHSPSPGMLH